MGDIAGLELFWIAFSLFLLGMSKGGFPVGSIALPLLILAWPGAAAARSAVAFMLPLLCAMDVVAVLLYRREIDWRRVLMLLPGSLVGVAIASALFVSDDAALLAVSDRTLKLCIGVLGVVFVLHRATQKWILRRLDHLSRPTWLQSGAFGLVAGITSTLAHAAAPIVRMYLLPQKMPKLAFAGTHVAFFFILNLVKVVPFAALGRLEVGNLKLGLYLLPVIPLGVVSGYGVVRVLKDKHYVGFIYTVLAVTSVLLIVKALTTG